MFTQCSEAVSLIVIYSELLGCCAPRTGCQLQHLITTVQLATRFQKYGVTDSVVYCIAGYLLAVSSKWNLTVAMSSSHHDEPERKRRKLAEHSDSTTDGDLDDSGDESEAQVIRVHIVPAKIEEEDMMELIGLVEGYHIEHTADASVEFVLKLAAKPQDADVIVTATHMKRRFERHVDWAIAVRMGTFNFIWRILKLFLEKKSRCYARVVEASGQAETTAALWKLCSLSRARGDHRG